MVGGSAHARVAPDYIAFTVTNDTPVSTVLAMLGFKFNEIGFGRYRYRQGAVAEVGGLEVYWDGCQDGMGTHVRISGKGCRHLEDDPFFEWGEWFSDIRKKLGGRFSRVDIAIDDEGYNVEFDTVLKAVENKEVTRRGDAYDERYRFRGGRKEKTLYIGSRESEAMLRVYQKGFELGGEVGWLRFEAEFKGKRAEGWVTVFLTHGWDAAVGVFRHLWEFKDASHVTTDRTRQRAADWWVQLIGAAKFSFKLGQAVAATWQSVQKWMVRQWAPSVAMLMEATAGDLSPLLELAEIGSDRLKEKHKRLIAVVRGCSDGSFANLSFA